jgi:CBS domain-containing protein
MKIREIMTQDAISVHEDVPISEIAEIISSKRIHGVPVVDNDNKVIGIITETDFFSKDSANMVYMPSLIDFMNRGKLNYTEEEKEVIKEVLNAKAKDIMTSKCENISPDMELEDFIKLIKEKSFNSYPVTDENGFLLGIMTIADAIKLL